MKIPKNKQYVLFGGTFVLAKETDTSRQNVSKMLEVLQWQSYVELQDSVKDHRSQTVVLTAVGTQMLWQTAQEAAPFFAELFSGIDAEECAIASGMVVKLIRKLGRCRRIWSEA